MIVSRIIRRCWRRDHSLLGSMSAASPIARNTSPMGASRNRWRVVSPMSRTPTSSPNVSWRWACGNAPTTAISYTTTSTINLHATKHSKSAKSGKKRGGAVVSAPGNHAPKQTKQNTKHLLHLLLRKNRSKTEPRTHPLPDPQTLTLIVIEKSTSQKRACAHTTAAVTFWACHCAHRSPRPHTSKRRPNRSPSSSSSIGRSVRPALCSRRNLPPSGSPTTSATPTASQ